MASGSQECSRLLEEINRLKQEKRTLNLRLQGVEVLGKVLQDSQDENAKLKQEVLQLKGELEGRSLDVTPSTFSLNTTLSMKEDRCFLSQQEDNSLSFPELSYEYVNSNPKSSFQAGPTDSPGTPGTARGELHIKELSSDFKTIKNKLDMLLQQAKELQLDLTGNVRDKSESTDLGNKLFTLLERIGKHAKEVKTRETLLQGLASEEEMLKKKVMDMELEQVTQEKVMEDLKLQFQDDKQELDSIREQIQFLSEAVVVNKEDASSLGDFSSSDTGSSASNSKMSSLSKSVSNNKELGELQTAHDCGKCSELMLQLKQVKKEKEEAIRQKEEILDVNHAWDAQYKKLKSETGKEVTDLKKQIEILQTSDLMASARNMIEQEKQAKEKALDEKNKLEEKCKTLEEELNRLSRQNRYQVPMKYSPQQQSPSFSLKSLPPIANYKHQLSTGSQSAASKEEPPEDMVKEIEVIKQQLRVYADDFECERRDRERMQSEKENMETELKDLREQVTVLTQQVRLYEEDFRKESQEKDRLRRQLNLQREGTDPETRLNDMTRKAQAVAERQARLRALREQYSREERNLLHDQQELQQTARVMAIHPESQRSLRDYSHQFAWPQRQDNIHPRGATETQRPSNDMFHGGEVQADSREYGQGFEVIDGANNELSCPRCFRAFPRGDEESYGKHMLKCIE